jgi:hypothetical protein
MAVLPSCRKRSALASSSSRPTDQAHPRPRRAPRTRTRACPPSSSCRPAGRAADAQRARVRLARAGAGARRAPDRARPHPRRRGRRVQPRARGRRRRRVPRARVGPGPGAPARGPARRRARAAARSRVAALHAGPTTPDPRRAPGAAIQSSGRARGRPRLRQCWARSRVSRACTARRRRTAPRASAVRSTRRCCAATGPAARFGAPKCIASARTAVRSVGWIL